VAVDAATLTAMVVTSPFAVVVVVTPAGAPLTAIATAPV
jgi:hypothetical protein